MSFAVRAFLFIAVWSISLCIANSINSIEDIKKEYSYIKEHIGKFSKKEKRIEDISTEGAVAEMFFDNSKIRLIKLKTFGELGKSEEEYFFKNNKIFFLYSVEYTYNAPMYVDAFDDNQTKLEQNRFYFIDNKLVRWINPKSKSISAKDSSFVQKEKEILEFVSKYLRPICNTNH